MNRRFLLRASGIAAAAGLVARADILDFMARNPVSVQIGWEGTLNDVGTTIHLGFDGGKHFYTLPDNMPVGTTIMVTNHSHKHDVILQAPRSMVVSGAESGGMQVFDGKTIQAPKRWPYARVEPGGVVSVSADPHGKGHWVWGYGVKGGNTKLGAVSYERSPDGYAHIFGKEGLV